MPRGDPARRGTDVKVGEPPWNDLEVRDSPARDGRADIAPLVPAQVGRRLALGHIRQEGLRLEEGKQEDEEEEPEAIVDFEAIFIPDAPTKAGLIVPQLAFYDVEEVYLLGTNLWHHKKLVDMAKDYVQGAIMPDGFYTGSRSIRVIKFVNQFEDAYGEKPGVIEATTYDTATMLIQIVNRPDVLSRNAIKNELLNIRDYPGVTGLTSFDVDGEAHKQLSLLQIDGSRFVELE